MKCDIDNSGRIELNEFVEHYLGTKVQLQMRERELRQAIVESNADANTKKTQLEQAYLADP